ncbi:hypothetical protein CVV38_02815 [Candidatus Peregrinibacteria bacterium HGW-Peregrinibacteria-1]|jgi:vacuolar-type H+-ATPase subunit I/STV1|nr:MAG: hypothetical protein CVV38_02815 [Candidatus Peregrinibacteria bacterium HGW-Peregrinibacteria-1]
MRIHRSLRKQINKIDPSQIADIGDDHLDELKEVPLYIKKAPGIVKAQAIRKSISKIDQLEKEIVRLETRIKKLEERRAIEAIKLEEKIANNEDIISAHLDI